MRNRFSDCLIVTILVFLPLFGLTQACTSNGPTTPKPPTDGHKPPPGENKAPTAVVSVVGSDEGMTPFTVKLDGSSSFDPNTDKLQYHWQFSDGGTGAESVVEHEFAVSGKHWARLTVIDPKGLSDDSDPLYVYGWGLANSAWPKFAHDERNSGVSPNFGPMIDTVGEKSGHPFPRTWSGGNTDAEVGGICVGYDGMVVYTQGRWLRARTADGAVLWNTLFESTITSWPAIAYDGSIIIATQAGFVHHMESDGKIIWSADISNQLGYPISFVSGVNIGHDRHIYIGGYPDYDPNSQFATAGLIALTYDGTLLWVNSFPIWLRSETNGSNVTWAPNPTIPAILPNGNIVINALGGRLYTPKGIQLAEMDFKTTNYNTGGVELANLGPPSVNRDGLICFNNPYGPLFLPDGTFITVLFTQQYYQRYPTDPFCAPAWADRSVNMPGRSGSVYNLATRLLEGGVDSCSMGSFKPNSYSVYQRTPYVGGAILDYSGRCYIGSYRLQMTTPLRQYGSYPYSHRVYQWGYGDAQHMTSPVIGNDRWLYVGMDNDLVALGD